MEALKALTVAEAKQQEYAANLAKGREEALSKLEASKETFKAELQKMVEEKTALDSELVLAKQDAFKLALKVEGIAELAVKHATSYIAEDAKLKVAAAETAAAEATLRVEERIRNAADEAASAVLLEARSAIEEALAAAEAAKEHARKVEIALVEKLNVLDNLAQVEAEALSSQVAVSALEQKLQIANSEIDRLCADIKAAEMLARAAEERVAKAEASVAEIQKVAEKDALEREKSVKSSLQALKDAAIARGEAAKVAFKAELETLQAAMQAAEKAGRIREQANLRKYEALRRSLAAAEASAMAWKGRALTVEGLLRKVQEDGDETIPIIKVETDVTTEGRMVALLESDSKKWDLLANGPRREAPEWMKRRTRVTLQGLPPRSIIALDVPVDAAVPLQVPLPDEVWSIARAKVKQDDIFLKEAAEKEALDVQRRALERALHRKTIRRLSEEGDEKMESGTGSGREIVLQAFNWESCRRKWYLELAPKAADLSHCGITTVWLPPPTQSVAPQGYMPSDLYNLNSAYGTQEELKSCIEEMHNHDILVLGDAVLNHRCAQKQSPNGIWNVFGGKLAWGPEAIVRDDPNFQGRGNPSSGDIFHAAPNIDHSQEFVRHDIKEWLNWLRTEIGYDGWRLDFVRGFWGGYVKEYIESSKPAFAIGEYWDSLGYEGGNICYNQDAHRQRIINWINATGGTSSAFDVTTKGILHAALHNEYWRLIDPRGKPPGVMGWWPSRAVTFLENHDTGSTQGHWPFPRDKLMQGYAYILTHCGTPTVFYDHFYDFGLHDPIAELLAARTRTGVHCRSPVKIFHANKNGYVAQVGDNLVMKIGGMDWNPSKQNDLVGSWERTVDKGGDYQIWELR
ncbi:hypothetical protein O6H91_02G072300 [Diphasiastrum complanatum]|nr:hypothetical protein O6H91_02G072300 [Diphasiastrum complanatum]